MKIISHRGFWKKESEKNSLIAFQRSFDHGFGIETDIRDQNGSLVISHDIPRGNCLIFEKLLDVYCSGQDRPTLALNIKADGLQNELKKLLNQYNIHNYFVFDMSVPDALIYKNAEFNVFTRQSEYETQPSLYEDAKGLWLDEFNGHWINIDVLRKHSGKKICIVSPELHKRPHQEEWNHYKSMERVLGLKDLMFCTDYPDKAEEFFNGKN